MCQGVPYKQNNSCVTVCVCLFVCVYVRAGFALIFLRFFFLPISHTQLHILYLLYAHSHSKRPSYRLLRLIRKVTWLLGNTDFSTMQFVLIQTQRDGKYLTAFNVFSALKVSVCNGRSAELHEMGTAHCSFRPDRCNVFRFGVSYKKDH